MKIPTSLRTTVQTTFQVVRDPRLLLWSVFLLFFPYYPFASGLPQPADWLLIILAPLMLRSWNGRLPADMARPYKALLTFVVYVIIVNLAWSVIVFKFTISPKQGFLLSPLFYIYNALMFLTMILMFLRYGEFLLWLTGRLVLMSVVAQVLISFVFRGAARRATLLFNNPNQLGYFAVLCACILLINQRRLKLSTLQVLIGVLAASYLSLLSSSKAALACIGMLGIALIMTRARTMLLSFVVLAVLVFTPNKFSDAIDRAHDRIVTDQTKGFVEERGYDRIINNPEYCVLGSGEGGYGRFKESTEIGSHEIHSSAGTLIFCYGIIGLVLFAMFVWLLLVRQNVRGWLVLLPAFAFGMTHQGLRFTLMWVLLGMAIALRHLDLVDKAKAHAARYAEK